MGIGRGVGAIVGMAMGDVSSNRTGYTSRTQLAILVAYNLIEHGTVVVDRLIDSIAELDGGGGSVVIGASDALSDWLRTLAGGTAMASALPSAEVVTRGVPV
jgi:hypothetical protein